jgi:hypothetical protein
MAATPTAMPWREAARKDTRQAARQPPNFDASRANSSFKMDAEEIIAVIAYVRQLWVHPFVADRPTVEGLQNIL